MLFTEMRKKEVVNMRDCRKLGRVVDLDLDECNGCIRRIKVSDKIGLFQCLPCCCSWICGEPEYVISYKEIKQIGPDIIVVDIC